MLLTPEESYLWNLARTWRRPVAPPAGLDWARVVEMARANRMQTLLHGVLTRTGALDALPGEPRALLEADVEKMRGTARLFSDSLRDYLQRTAAAGVETVVLKGLSVSIDVYGDPAMRPGGDIDLLVRARDVDRSLAIQAGMGIGAYWDNLMDDRYYERHHLHQQRCTRDLRLWYETHWALDHPLTRLTVDYDAVMDRATPGTLLGAPVATLTTPDLILCLSLHLVKHALYLPSVLEREDLARVILADGMLMYFLDVAETIKQSGSSLDWPLAVRLAHEWGAVDVLGSVLSVCARLLDTPVPRWVSDALPVRGPGPLTRFVMQRVADSEVATHTGRPPNRFWDFLLITNGAFILRPIRLLDLAGYCFPGSEYLLRRYGSDSPLTAAKHIARALVQYARVGGDTLYFTFERYRRLKILRKSASLFNRLDEWGG